MLVNESFSWIRCGEGFGCCPFTGTRTHYDNPCTCPKLHKVEEVVTATRAHRRPPRLTANIAAALRYHARQPGKPLQTIMQC
jgi:hypothetical protein